MPATVSATRTVPAFGLAPAAPLPRATPPAAAPQPAAGVPVAAPAPVSLPPATPPAAVLREATALEGEDVPPAGEAAAPEAAEDVAEIDAAEAAEEEPSEETAAPVVAPPVPPRRAATVELESRALEETTDPEIQPPTGEGIGVLDPMEALRAAEEAVQDVFAPPAPPRSRMGPAAAESTGDEEVAPPSHSIHLDAVASVISIPEDDIPRTRAVSAAIGSLPAEESLLEGPAATAAEPAAGSGAAEGSRAEHSEEIVDVDVQPVEAEEAPAAGATVEPVAVVVETPPRPSAAPARPKGRRRRRHGERRAWWEEIFDEEHIRSLPKYSAEQTRNELDFIERALGVAKTARILDLGCGDGRQAVELAHRGYEVVGLDLSLPMLARAGDAAQAKGVKINFIQGDMRDLRFEGAFDAVYCVGSTFGYFDDDTNQAVLSSVFRALKPGGRLLLGMTNRDYVTLNQPRSTWFQGDDRQYLEDTDFNFITSRLVVKRSWATSAGDQETVEYTIRLYSLHELGKILHAAGFRVIEVSGHVVTPGVFFGADSANLLLLAERP
ncbi:MAG: L-histidine N(alpha)-methyltransferase [Deltaproteobacteria bacterium]|nr:L-histidine N(alpha)-methyltransferase [Deltaproteobacteria bacterium]